MNGNKLNRRGFLQNSMLGIGIFSGLKPNSDPNFSPSFGPGSTMPNRTVSYTVQDIMDLIFKLGNLSPIANTVDTLKTGTADQIVTGIATTMFATLPVIEEAMKREANFIITHEPTFYNHNDSIHFVENNQVLQKKMDLLNKNNMVVWRFHDYIHTLKPDAISYGFARKMGWETYFDQNPRILNIPPISIKDLIGKLKSRLSIKHLRFMGDPNAQVAKIGLIPGAAGGQGHITLLETEKPDILLVGEAPEWETVEYMRDSQFFGNKTGLIILGHGMSESVGMEYFAEWLKSKLPEIQISFIPFQDPFTWA